MLSRPEPELWIWRVSWGKSFGDPGTFQQFIVADTSLDMAKRVYPSGDKSVYWDEEFDAWVLKCASGKKSLLKTTEWANNIDNLNVELLGEANDHLKPGQVICAEYREEIR